MRIPHDHQHLLGHYHMAGPKEIEMAINSAMEAWDSCSYFQKSGINSTAT